MISRELQADQTMKCERALYLDHVPLNPIARCATMPARFFLGKYSADADFGEASSGEWRDVMDPDPACLP